jgi:hypothetical protein
LTKDNRTRNTALLIDQLSYCIAHNEWERVFQWIDSLPIQTERDYWCDTRGQLMPSEGSGMDGLESFYFLLLLFLLFLILFSPLVSSFSSSFSSSFFTLV